MNRLLDRPLRGMLSAFSRPACQPLLETLQRAVLAGMNIGPAGDPLSSGEVHVLRYCARLWPVNGSWVIFDAGARQGAYALLASSVLGPSCRVYCFEPSRASFQQLAARAARAPNLQAYNLGLGEAEGEVTLYSDEPGSGIASVYPRRLEHHGLSLRAQEVIRVRTLDAVRQQLGVARIQLLKLDIEGHELRALQGARQSLEEAAIDCIQFEFGGCNIDSRTYLRDFFELLSQRYRLYRVLRRGLYELPGYREIYESFLTANYLAVAQGLTA